MIQLQEVQAPQSPNRSNRVQPISCIVVHDTGGHGVEGTLDWFRRKESQVSAHVVIDRDGTIYRVVPDNFVAWHAGESSLHGATKVNQFSLGVELVDDSDSDEYSSQQWSSLVSWCAVKAVKYKVPLSRVIGHCHVSPGRKIDPGPDFDWYRFGRSLAVKMDIVEL